MTSIPSREAQMGQFERIGTWPDDIVVEDSRIMYLPGELVVFAQDTDSGLPDLIAVWSYYESNNTWVKVGYSGPAPDIRLSSPAFATDPDGQRAFFFGGQVPGASRSNELFVYNHTNRTWIKPVLPDVPAGRTSASMVYDPLTGMIWVYGGQTGQNSRSDRLYNCSLTDGWTEHNPSVKPAARSSASMEVHGEEIYIALGYAGGWTGYLSDMWTFDMVAGSWTRITEDLDVRTHGGAAFVYDNGNDVLLLTLGFNYHSGGGGGWYEYLNHTYRINPANGSAERVHIDPRITPRSLQAWTMDGDDILIFGGSQGEQDVWRLDVGDLSATGVAPTTYNAGGTSFTGFDTESGGTIYIISRRSSSFGDGGEYLSWMMTYFTFADRSWHFMDVTPPVDFEYHDNMGSTYDEVGNRFYFYGGRYSYTVGSWPNTETHYYFYDSFWSLDVKTGVWTMIHEHAKPGPLGSPGMVMDNTGPYRKLFLYGGQVPNGQSDDVSLYNISAGTWTKLTVPIKPPGRYDTPLTMAPSMKAFVMFGGRDNSSNVYDDLWIFHTDSLKWEQLSGAQDPPSTRYSHGLSVNPVNNEIMVYGKYAGGWGGGDPDDMVYLYRPGWKEWISVEEASAPHAWYSHGQVYNTNDDMVYLWKGPSDPSAIYRYVPILRTISEGARIVDGSGVRQTDVYPTVLDYKLRLTGYTDIGLSDIVGMEIEFRSSTDSLFIHYEPGEPLAVSGNTSWVHFNGGITLTQDPKNGWTLEIPLEFTFDAPEGEPISIYHTPITLEGYTEQRQALNSFTLHSDLEVSRVTFSSNQQPEGVEPGDWLYGGADLVLSGFQLSFSADSSKHPTNSSFTVTFSNQEGANDTWDSSDILRENLTVPIVGTDGGMARFYLNVTDDIGTQINTQVFEFKLDKYAPEPPANVSIRADSASDTNTGKDNDQEVYLAWDTVYDGGSGVKGVCYSIDENLWPSQENLISEPKKFNIFEGDHTFYVWTVDKAERSGPVAEVPIIIDLHRPVFLNPFPAERINITDETYPVSIDVMDELVGLDLSSFKVRWLQDNNDWGPWGPVDEAVPDVEVYTLKVEVPLLLKRENLIQFTARDLVGNSNESQVLIVYTDPDLKDPVINSMKPADGTRTVDKITLEWSGKYIQQDELTYELVVTGPTGAVERIDMGTALKKTYTPMKPGIYIWSVVAKAGEKSATSAQMTFEYDPPFATIKAPSGISVKQNTSFDATFTVDNDLRTGINLTFNKVNVQGFEMLGSSIFPLAPGKGQIVTLRFNSSSAVPGSRRLSFNVTDEFGRFSMVDMTVTVEEPEVLPPEDGPDGEDNMMVFIIIGVLVLLVVIAIVAVIMFTRRKRDVLSMKVEGPDEDAEAPVDLSYDPTGVVAKGSAHKASVGTSAYEHLQRGSSSNVMELPIQKEEEMEEFDELEE